MPRKAKPNGDHYYDPFPQRLRSLMEERGLTQEDLVPILKVKTRQSVTGYIDGSTSPTGDKVAALASFFGVSSDYLLGLQNDPTNEAEMKAVCQFTGLSSKAIEVIQFCKDILGYSDMFSELIAIGSINELLINLWAIKHEIIILHQLMQENNFDTESFSEDDLTALNEIANDLTVKVEIRLPRLVKDIPVKMFGYDPKKQDQINDRLAEIRLRKREARYNQTEIKENDLGWDIEEREAKNGKQHIENN